MTNTSQAADPQLAIGVQNATGTRRDSFSPRDGILLMLVRPPNLF